MRVLVIPEDHRKDQYMLNPLLSRLLKVLGKPRAQVRVCQDPCLGGAGEAMKSKRIQEIVEQYRGMTDIFILCIDRDGKQGRRTRLDDLEEEFNHPDCVFIAVNAWEEIEAWVLAGVENLPQEWNWKDIRSEIHVKEEYFDKLVRQRGLVDHPSSGRQTLAEEASHRIPAIRAKCPEDFDDMAQRLGNAL